MNRLMTLAAAASVSVAASLVVTKTFVWLATASVSMMGSLADSALDLVASLITFVAVRAALMPPDTEHRFGHGKAEGLAALFQAAIMMGSATFLLIESASRIVNPVPVEKGLWAIAVSVLAIVLSLALVTLQRWVIRQTGSMAIAADNLHYTGDLLMNLGVIIAIALTVYGEFLVADGVFGCLIAFYIARSAYQVGRQAVDMLMDRELPDADRERIFNLAMENQQVRGLHDLKTRTSGLKSFIQLHIEVDPELTVAKAHFIADEVEATIGEAFPNAEILIHVDPVGAEGPDRSIHELLEQPSS